MIQMILSRGGNIQSSYVLLYVEAYIVTCV